MKYVQEKLVPEGAEDVKISLENYRLGWVLDSYTLTFKVGLTEAKVKVNSEGEVTDVSVGRPSIDTIKSTYGGEVTSAKDGYTVRVDKDWYIEELKLNRFGEVIGRSKAVKEDYAVSLAYQYFGVRGGRVRHRREGGAVKVDIALNGYRYLAKVDEEVRIADSLVVPDLDSYKGVEKGYNEKRRALIVKYVEGDEEVVKVITDKGVMEEKRNKRSFFRKLLDAVKREYSIDTEDPLDLI